MSEMTSVEKMQELVLKAPFHRWLGLRVKSVGDGSVTIAMPWREEFVSNPEVRYTHGGLLATLIDIAADYAIASKLGHGVPTVDMRIDYHKPALPPDDLIATGRLIKLGRMLAVAEAEIADAAGALIASGRGVYLVGMR